MLGETINLENTVAACFHRTMDAISLARQLKDTSIAAEVIASHSIHGLITEENSSRLM